MVTPLEMRNTQAQYIRSFAIALIDGNQINPKEPKYRDFFKNTKETKSLENFKKQFASIAEKAVSRFRSENWEQVSGIPSAEAAADVLLQDIYENLLEEYKKLSKPPA
jgi:hypothetical protein